ncbi:hypothetical protein AVEN_93039-1 [Araneus ventricosus]|uniref:Uncharacterized protein n=1 Tax=Araneus ventricosus TaxID=182803 RepID=A0A4Y2CWC4_ARAVE|nr:hypothetical protein AVEN_233268-1 [Araneus ventricosus]GBM08782.1 hypothetical protein AVEN_93039-1 [Araneus ventricosus]
METCLTTQQLCDLENMQPQHPPCLLLGLGPVQSCLGIARVTSKQKVSRTVDRRIVRIFRTFSKHPYAFIGKMFRLVWYPLTSSLLFWSWPRKFEGNDKTVHSHAFSEVLRRKWGKTG